MNIAQWLHERLQYFGYDYVRIKPPTRHPLGIRKQLMQAFGIKLVLDVGANRGQFATNLRRLGYKNKIISFEPVSVTYKLLSDAARHDRLWKCIPYALGDYSGKTIINVSNNLESSSLHQMLELHKKVAPESFYIRSEEITIRKLDEILPDFRKTNETIFLKIDTQGHELSILKGAKESLKFVSLLQLELSFVSLYSGELLFPDMIKHLETLGFRLAGFDPGLSDLTTGSLLQADCLFIKND